MSTSGPLRPTRLRPLVQLSGFLRKEVVEIVRQPRLLVVLVAGPFLVLLLFAVGYDQEQTVLHTRFVGPEGSVYEQAIGEFSDELSQYIVYDGFSSDLVAAEEDLADGDIDLVVVFPADPVADVLSGEQAVISVLHDKIDPIQQTAVEVSTRVAVQELNATVLEEILVEARQRLVPYEEGIAESAALAGELEAAAAAGDAAGVERLADDLRASVQGMSAIVDVTESVSRELRGELAPAQQDRLDELSEALRDLDAATEDLAAASGAPSPDEVAEARRVLDRVETVGEGVTTLDPAVAVRPFAGDTANLVRQRVDVDDYFAPAAIALLLQHMVLTFAAMSIVSDRALGLFEVFRVGPIGAGRILAGKFVAYVLLGGAVAAALIAAVTLALDVPLRGAVGWVALGVAGLLAASIGAGMVLSLLARTDTQAVQYSMLALLAGLFFGGFLLDLDAFHYPVKAISWAMPVTYGVRLLRDVMLRGVEPSATDLAGLAITAVVYCGLAWAMFGRRLRVR